VVPAFGLFEAEPSRVTSVPVLAVWSGPALATGATGAVTVMVTVSVAVSDPLATVNWKT